jgi:hypothetical protein
MPSQSSQAGYIAFRTYGGGDTFPSDIDTAGAAFRLRSGTIGPNRELMIPDPEIGGNRDVPDANLGPVSFSGDLEMYVRLSKLGTLLAAALGTASAPVVASGASTYTITGADTAGLPWLAAEERIGASYETFHYTDILVNTFHLECDASGYMMGTVGLIARKQSVATGVITGSELAAEVDISPLIVGTNISITYNSVTVPAKSFSLDINNNIEDDDFRLGSFYLGDITPKRREVTSNVTLRPTDSAFFRQAAYGAASATAPGGLVTKQPLVINAASYEDIPGATAGVKYNLGLTIPKAAFQPFAVAPSGDDIIEHSVDIQALRVDPAVSILTATLRTDATALA